MRTQSAGSFDSAGFTDETQQRHRNQTLMTTHSSEAPVIDLDEKSLRRRVRESRKLSKGEEIFFDEVEKLVGHAFVTFFLGSHLAYSFERFQSQEAASDTAPSSKIEPEPSKPHTEPVKTPTAPTGSSSATEGAVSVAQEAASKRTMPLTYAQRAAQAARVVPANTYASSLEQSSLNKVANLDSYKKFAESGLIGGAKSAVQNLEDGARRVAYQGVHFMAVTTSFRAALAINDHVFERPEDPTAFGAAGAVAGAVHGCFLNPFSFRVLLTRSFTLGLVGVTGGLIYRNIQRRREQKLNGEEN